MAQDTLTRRIAVLTACFVLAAPAFAAGPAEPEPELRGYVEHVEVHLVLLRATVENKHGQIVTDLSPDDFVLKEDGVKQEISVFGTSHDQAVKVAFLLDVSGSMAIGGRINQAKEAIRRFVGSLQPEDQVALMSFADSGVHVNQGFTRNRFEFYRHLGELKAYGETALRDALVSASSLMEEAAGSRAGLILVSDGEDNASRMSRDEAVALARQVQVPIYAIGFTHLPPPIQEASIGSRRSRSFGGLLDAFAGETGGERLRVFDMDDVAAAVSLVEDQLRGQYVIGYHPSEPPEKPGFRRIDLETKRPSLTVHTRKGYVATP